MNQWKISIARGFFLSLSLCLIIQQPGWSAPRYAGEFFSLGVGARPMGMAGACVAISDDASAVYWNPAGLVGASRRQLLLMHAESFGGLVLHDYLGLVLPLRANRSALGLGLLRLGVEDIPYTDWDPMTQRPRVLREVDDAEYALFFSYARTLGSSWRMGGSAKLVRKAVGHNSALGMGLDVGWQYQPGAHLAVGAKLADITTTPLSWDTGHREYIFPMLKLGAAYGQPMPFLRGEVFLALDVDTWFEGRKTSAWTSLGGVGFEPRAGLEYWYRHRVAVRGGIEADRFSTGASLRLGVWGVDYAFLGHDELDSSHRISASMEF